MRNSGADLGIAHDGDADRTLLVDKQGRIIDGDAILAALAISMSDKGKLKKNTVVTTVMSNLGFHKKMSEVGISVEITAVGDRYVLERINAEGLSLGGEQSGHVIIRELLERLPISMYKKRLPMLRACWARMDESWFALRVRRI